jgi:hypothetical protein
MWMRWDHSPELWPLTGLLFIPQIIHESGEPRWNDIDRGKPKNSKKKACTSVTLSTTNPTGTGLGANQGLRGETSATNRLSHGTAEIQINQQHSVISHALLLTLVMKSWLSSTKEIWKWNQTLEFLCTYSVAWNRVFACIKFKFVEIQPNYLQFQATSY